jgi:hypothetical protein
LILRSLTLCSTTSHSTSTQLQEHVMLPTLSVSEFTSLLPNASTSTEESPGSQLLLTLSTNHWKTMQNLFCEPLGRARNLYLATSSLMRAVTEVRISARYGIDSALQSRVSALESDFVAVTFALPPYMFSPSRHLDTDVTTDDHRSRLNMLLVFCW